jgi:hypothetical protein
MYPDLGGCERLGIYLECEMRLEYGFFVWTLLGNGHLEDRGDERITLRQILGKYVMGMGTSSATKELVKIN